LLRSRRAQLVVVTAGLLIAGGLPAVASVLDRPVATATVSSPTQAGAQARIVATAPTKVTVVIKGKRVSKRVARPTRLQNRRGSVWVPSRRAVTARSGRVVYRIAAPAVTTKYRVTAPAKTVRISRVVSGRTVTKRARLRAWTSPVTTVTIAGPSQTPTSSPSQSPSQTPTQGPSQTPTQGPTQTPSQTPTQTPTQDPQGTEPWVTGYYLGYYWDVGDMLAPEDVDMSALTHFMFGRTAPGGGDWLGNDDDPVVYPDYPYEAGELIPAAGSAHRPGYAPDGSGRSVEEYLVDKAHDAGKKALVMVGGMGDGPAFIRSSADGVRKQFAKSIVDYLVAHDYDGFDLDWEDCLKGESNCGEAEGDDPVSGAEVQRRLMALIADVRAEAAKRPRYAKEPVLITFPGYTLTPGDSDDFATEPDGTVSNRAVKWRVDIANAVDQYNLMSYGIGTTWWDGGWDSWFSSALKGAGPGHPRDLASSIDAYVAGGVPRDRIGVGIGFFGIYYGPKITGPRQSLDAKGNTVYEDNDNDLGYGYLDRMGYTRNGTLRWDEESQSTYRTYEQFGAQGYVPPHNSQHPLDETRVPAGFLSYEDERAIEAKGAYVKETGAGGTIIWALNYGWVERTQKQPLLAAVKHAFLE
jgi:chitinase